MRGTRWLGIGGRLDMAVMYSFFLLSIVLIAKAAANHDLWFGIIFIILAGSYASDIRREWRLKRLHRLKKGTDHETL